MHTTMTNGKGGCFCRPSRRPLARTGHQYLHSQSRNTCKGSLRMGCNNDERGFGGWVHCLKSQNRKKKNVFLKAKQAMLPFPLFLKTVFLSN